MRSFRSLRAALVAVAFLATAIFAYATFRPPQVAQASTTIELEGPVQQDAASADAALLMQAIQDEAGISAWFDAGAQVNLSVIAPVFRTIEAQTESYLIGSLELVDYPEDHDVHLYVHRDGWFLAYYLKSEPVAKMIDILHYPGEGLKTKFEVALGQVAAQAGVPYVQPKFWDFRYPNANRIMLIGETDNLGDNFNVMLPESYNFYEESWTSEFLSPFLNGGNLTENGCVGCSGVINVSLLPPNTTHEFRSRGDDNFAIALTYGVP